MLIRYRQECLSSQRHKSQVPRYRKMLDGNVILRQERDEVPQGIIRALNEIWLIIMDMVTGWGADVAPALVIR